MSVLVKADIDGKIATHAVLTTGVHGVGALNIAGFHSSGEALSKVIWKNSSESALSDLDRTVSLGMTDLDLTAFTSANAKAALVQLEMRADVIGTGNSCLLALRKNGTSPAHRPSLQLDKAGATAAVYQFEMVLIGLDSGRIMEYLITVGTGWTIDSRIRVLGYIE